MSQLFDPDSSLDDGVRRLVEEYLGRLLSGSDVSREEFLADHDDVAPDLNEQLRILDQIRDARNLARLRSSTPAGTHDGEDTSVEPSEPILIPDYEAIRLIDRGGFGDVWLCRNEHDRHFYAVKCVKRSESIELKSVRELKKRGDGIEHLLPIYHVGQSPAGIYYVLPLADDVKGMAALRDPADYEPLTLERLLANHGPLSLVEAADVLESVLSALGSLHDRGAVHCDVKPANILSVTGRWKLGDHGLLAAADQIDACRGTPGFRPPGDPNTPGADLYAAGMCFLVMLTGKPPADFEPGHLARGAMPQLGSRDQRRVRDVVRRSRGDDVPYRSAREMLADVRRLTPRDRRRTWWSAAAAVILLAAIGFGVLARNGRSTSPAPVMPEAPVLDLAFDETFARIAQARRTAPQFMMEGAYVSNEKLVVGEQPERSGVTRSLEAGWWVATELSIEFPELENAGDSSDLAVFFKMTHATGGGPGDIRVQFRQRREEQTTRLEVEVLDAMPTYQAVSGRVVASRTLSVSDYDGDWFLEYRHGIIQIGRGTRSSPREVVLWTYLYRGDARVSVLGLEAAGRHLVDRWATWQIPPERTLTVAERQRLRRAEQLRLEGRTEGDEGRHDSAIAMLERSRAMVADILGEGHPFYTTPLAELADVYRSRHPETAEQYYRQAIDVLTSSSGPRHPNTTEAMIRLAQFYYEQGRMEEAEQLYRDVERASAPFVDADNVWRLRLEDRLRELTTSEDP